MSRRRGSLRALALGLPLIAAVALLASAEAIVSHGVGLACVIVVLSISAYLLGRWHGRRSAIRPRRPIEPQPVESQPAELARLRGDNAKLRTKVRALSDMINGPEIGP